MSSVVSSIFGGPAPGSVQTQPLTQASTVDQANQTYQQSQDALSQQQGLLSALQAQNGLQNQSQVYNQQQGIVNGTGPNPAQAQLAQATGANVANQAALMAGQRGAASNVGLMSRQAAQQGANTQQQAAGQAATLQANQSLNALNNAGNIANQQASNQLAGTNAYNQAAQGLHSNVIGGLAGQNQNQVALNQVNSGAQQANAGMQANLIGNLAGAAGSALAMAEGGAVPEPTAPPRGPSSKIAQHFMAYANGGQVQAMVSPGEQYLPPKAAQAVAKGEAKPLQSGERIPGTPKVKGNSYANDVVPKTLEAGGVVIPNSIMQHKDAEKKAAEFVRQVLAKKQGLPSKGKK